MNLFRRVLLNAGLINKGEMHLMQLWDVHIVWMGQVTIAFSDQML